jgi:peroxiredoxin
MPEHFIFSLRKARISMPRLVLLVSLTLALAFISIEAMSRFPAGTPDVAFTTITGKKIALKDLRGKPVVVTFWATDCPACMREIPHLVDLYAQYHKQGLEIIAIAMSYDPPNHVVTMTENQQLPYDVALDLTAELARSFGNVQLTPSTFLISPDGSFVLQKIGPFDIAEMKSRIELLLKG